MDLGIKNRVAFVTASSKGIGYAVARQLSGEGARVSICSRDKERIEEAAQSIHLFSGNEIMPLVGDVTNPHDIDRMIQEVIEHWRRMDILVVNAGGPPYGDFMQFNDEDWYNAINLNLMSGVRLSRLAAPYMMQNRWGRIIYITSISVRQPIEGLILSNAVRAAATGLAKSQAMEWAKHNILVNCVGPGYTKTNRIVDLYKSQGESRGMTLEEILEEKSADIPLGRLAEPDEFANVVTFLCSEKASYMTGSNITVDGGAVKGLL